MMKERRSIPIALCAAVACTSCITPICDELKIPEAWSLTVITPLHEAEANTWTMVSSGGDYRAWRQELPSPQDDSDFIPLDGTNFGMKVVAEGTLTSEETGVICLRAMTLLDRFNLSPIATTNMGCGFYLGLETCGSTMTITQSGFADPNDFPQELGEILQVLEESRTGTDTNRTDRNVEQVESSVPSEGAPSEVR